MLRRNLIISVLVFSLALLGATEPARAQNPPLKAEDVFQFELASDPQISPDGKQIVYVRQFADIMSDRNYSNLWIINADGTGHRPLTTGSVNDTAPRWSPDGSRLLYLSEREGRAQIFVRWMDSGTATAVTNLEFPPSGASWSPDGKQIAFLSFVKGQPVRVAARPAPPAGARWAEPPRIVDRLVYRFNGPGYLREGYYQVFVVPAEGGTPRQITSGNFHHGTATGAGGATAWTPDGKYVLVSANRRDDWEYEPRDTEVYEVSVDDGRMRALTNRRGPDGSPAVSPDGSRIAYLGYDDHYQGYQLTRLYVMERDGSKSRAISAALDRDIISPRWTPDGKAILFAYDEQGNTRLATITLDGKVSVLTGNLGGAASAYSGGVNFSQAANGAIAFTYTTPYVPADVALLAPNAAQARALTALNHDLLSQRLLGRVEQIWYESSKDKRKIHGWIIRPPDFDPRKKYPMILEIHGGPFANYGDRFDFEKQVWAGMGYVVFYANPRGSTSYGEEFGNLIHHAYPGDDFFDLNSGVDAVLAQGYVDPERVFVGGGSGGGVLTAWMIGRSTRFRAAVAYYPVINWISWTLTSDIPIVGAKYWFPGNPWDHLEQYWKRSLLSVVKNVKTPTMIITGEEDWRTPMSESEQYYTALKLLQVETVLVRVPGEPHGIRRRPSHWMTKILEIGAWYEKFRK